MIVDIRDDIPDFLSYVRTRVKAQAAKKKSPPVSAIQFGFEFGQANWVALVFDTREKFQSDGSWTTQFENILLERPKWPIWHKLPDDEQVHFIDIVGERKNVMADPDNLICPIVGDCLKQVLITARDEGLFTPLNVAKRCELMVENLEGYYGWPVNDYRGKENLL